MSCELDDAAEADYGSADAAVSFLDGSVGSERYLLWSGITIWRSNGFNAFTRGGSPGIFGEAWLWEFIIYP